MKKTMFACGAALLLGATPATAAGEIYRCSARNVSGYEDDGTLGKFPNNFWTDHWTNILVDTTSGILRRSKGEVERWAVIQKGGGGFDFVAAPQADLVSASTDVLRVRAWDNKPGVTFIYFGLSMIVTGVCEPVR